MDIPELFTTLVNHGFRLSVEGSEIVVSGTGKLSSELSEAIKENKPEIVKLIEPEEQIERESFQFADTDAGRTQAEKVGDDFLEMASRDHLGWLSRQIEKQTTLEELDGFARRFENDLSKYTCYRLIDNEIRELIQQRRVLLYNANSQGADTPQLF